MTDETFASTLVNPPGIAPDGSFVDDSGTVVTAILEAVPPDIPAGAEMMTCTVEVPPGSAGTPPHRHTGPVFGYVLEGEVRWELEGEPERVLRAGDPFWEPGGDVIHYQAGNNLSDTWTRFIAIMFGIPGQQMLTLVDPAELEQRQHLRAPRRT